MAGISRDRHPLSVCAYAAFVWTYFDSFPFKPVARQRAQHEDQQWISARGQSTFSALGFRLWLSCSNYPRIYSRTTYSLMRIMRVSGGVVITTTFTRVNPLCPTPY